MIEGGGLGVYTPEEVGPMSFQVPNGVVDVIVKDEFAGVDPVKTYLSDFQGPISTRETHDQRKLRHALPGNRLRLYDMRDVAHTIADQGDPREIRPRHHHRVHSGGGPANGVIANNPHHLFARDRRRRFRQEHAFHAAVRRVRCSGLNLIDCPGIMVGPDAERTALVRHCTRLFNVGANMTVPLFTVWSAKPTAWVAGDAGCGGSGRVLLGGLAPRPRFAGMNREGAVKLGYRRELMAIEDPEQRLSEYQRRTAIAYDNARAVNA